MEYAAPVSTETRKRPWLAAVLAVIYPGLGHIYLRSWFRAILWFGAVLFTATVFIPDGAVQNIASVGDLFLVAEAIPLEAALALLVVASFNVIDAYWLAKQSNAAVDNVHCPYCGKVVDEDLAFCHWCTGEFQIESSE